MHSEIIKTYKRIYNSFNKLSSDILKLESEVIETIGYVVSPNIYRGITEQNLVKIYIVAYRKTYQKSVDAFNVIRNIYEKVARRKTSNPGFPLRLEIDAFIGFVRDRHATGDKWNTSPVAFGKSQELKLLELIEEWLQTPSPYFEKTVVDIKYAKFLSVFESKSSFLRADDKDIFEALCIMHSFSWGLEHLDRGLKALFNKSRCQNDINRFKKNLKYLIYGKDDVIERMANLLFNPKYKPNIFSKSNVQELIGWQNKEELPVVNSRTTKILRYFGFDVPQL